MKIRTAILSSISFAVLLSCNSKKNDGAEGNTNHFVATSVLLDPEQFKTTTKHVTEFGKANYVPLYIGQLIDSISINYELNLVPPPPPPPPDGWPKDSGNVDSFEEYRHLNFSDNHVFAPETQVVHVANDSAVIRILVDTSTQIRSLDFNHYQDETYAFQAYPVFIENHSKHYAYVGYGSYLDLILEAKNQEGEWQPTERNYKYHCGTGLEDILLASGEIALTSVPIFEGNHSTKLRLRQRDGIAVSNEFDGTIELGQFEKPR